MKNVAPVIQRTVIVYATYVKRINQKTPQQSQKGKHVV